MSLAGRSAADADVLVADLSRDYEAAALTPADGAMLAYAVKLTREPAAVSTRDADLLRAVGFGDRAIHDLCAVTAYYAFVNRVAQGLGVELESRFKPDQ